MYGSHDNTIQVSVEALQWIYVTADRLLTQSIRRTACNTDYTSIHYFNTPMSISPTKHHYIRLEGVGGNESNDSLISIIRGRVVVDGVSSDRDSVGSEIAISDRGVELLGRINLGHVGT
jgi:hypothetical protein